MQCKNHPDRQAERFCAGCGIPLCGECAEETKPGEYYCFKCAMLVSVSAVGTTMKGKKERLAERKEKEKEKKKWTPFRYFVLISSVLILVMWGVIIFGGQKAPEGAAGRYPTGLTDLVPKYLPLKQDEVSLLSTLSYAKDPYLGYRLSLAQPRPGEMNLIISPKGIKYETSASGGS